MTVRNGYVSNSSTGSFIVIIKDDSTSFLKITEEQKKLLFGYGFRYVYDNWRSVLMNSSPVTDYSDSLPDKDSPICMYYEVSCDEADVEEFLFENKIPFVASEQYDTEFVHYDGIHDWCDRYMNAGTHFAIYGLHSEIEDKLDKMRFRNMKPFTRTRISDGADITDEALKEVEDI